jgi:superfamily II DNA or RNA helicase
MSEDGRLSDLELDVLYEGWGLDVLDKFIKPALEQSIRYDRLTGYFTVNSLLAVAEGIDDLWRRSGEMRLIIGIHDIPPELLEAKQLEEPSVEHIVDSVRSRLLDEASTIEEELHRNKLATLAWMLNDGLLEIRVACPRTHQRLSHEGIFHKKRLIFRDAGGNRVVGVGSPNETAAGFHENIEELTVFRTWEPGQRPIAERHITSFEDIWENQRDYLEVVELHSSFAAALLERLGSPDRPTDISTRFTVQIDDLLATARESPAYSTLAFDNVGLYPHQERVFVEALSRWPIRVLLADEVGLGKTLEAGAILTYLLRFGGVEEATILAPANLLKQWQEELHIHFGLSFWRWDSTQRAYVDPNGTQWNGALDGDPVGPEAPDRVLISAQLARGTRRKGHIYEDKNQLPEVLFVDEAHAARVRPTLDGSTRPTRLWRTLDDITDSIPHVVFMTATPLQTNLEEYHALLDLLGLPGIWEDFEVYKRSLEILSKGERAKSLRNAQKLLQLVAATITGMDHLPDELSETEADLVQLAENIDGSPGLNAANAVMAEWESAYNLLVQLHPAHLLTLRNNRISLVERGYRFPERRFESPALDIPPAIDRFYDGLHEYLWEAYGQVEQAADPDREISLGFTKSSYHQRTASSLHSAVCSLENRLAKIDAISEGADADEDILTEEYEEPDIPDEASDDAEIELEAEDAEIEVDAAENTRLARAESIERAYIKDLLSRLETLSKDGRIRDPKMDAMIERLEAHLPEEGVLVFSRYTDTLDACLETFRDHRAGNLDVGYGMYTGSQSWIYIDGVRTEATKQDVRHALEDGDIRVVFCSEAAAEGLNLQAARVMINIDVPWNPAKLEQRIGRIARLGQSAEEVLIYNLWYPDSVEAKMYTRLTKRKDLYDIAVGQSPEIVSEAIRAQVSTGNRKTDQAVEQLGAIRQSMQHKAIQRVWGSMDDSLPLSTQVRRNLLELLARWTPEATFYESKGGARLTIPTQDDVLVAGFEPEDRSILTLNHDILQLLDDTRGSLPAETTFHVLEDTRTNHPLAFCLERDDAVAIIPPSKLPALLAALLDGASLDETIGTDDWIPKNQDALWDAVHEQSRWLPDHSAMRVLFDATSMDSLPDLSQGSSDHLKLRGLGETIDTDT